MAKKFRANTRAPRRSYAIPASSPVGGKGKAKYPISSIGRARSALSRVQAHGTAKEKQMVYAKVRSRYPSLANRSSVVPTRTGTGRHFGQPRGTRNG